jgi:hypothetical protein
LAKSENGIGNAKGRDDKNGPAENDDDGVGATEPERAVFQVQRQRMQDGKTGECIGHDQGCGDDQRQDRRQPASKAASNGDEQDGERRRRQRAGATVLRSP